MGGCLQTLIQTQNVHTLPWLREWAKRSVKKLGVNWDPHDWQRLDVAALRLVHPRDFSRGTFAWGLQPARPAHMTASQPNST